MKQVLPNLSYLFLDFSPWISLGTFSILLTSSLKALNRIKRNLTGSKVSTFSTKFVFPAGRKTKMAAPASDWLRYFGPCLWNYWTEIDITWKKARSQRPLLSLLLICIEFRLMVKRNVVNLWDTGVTIICCLDKYMWHKTGRLLSLMSSVTDIFKNGGKRSRVSIHKGLLLIYCTCQIW